MSVPGGKGSTPRPFTVSSQVFGENWDKIFGTKEDEQKVVPSGNANVELNKLLINTNLNNKVSD